MKPGADSEADTNPGRVEAPGATRGVAGHRGEKSQSPLYVQVARALREEIVNGAYPVGSLLPTEDRLCQRFSVSRYTIREALRLLREDGLVSSRQGAGTAVIPPRSAGNDMQQFMSIDDLLAFGTDTRLVIESIKIVTLDEKLAARAGLSIGEEWLQVRGYRHSEAPDAPLCWTEIYINRAFAAVGRLLQRHTGPIFPLIEDLFGQSVVEVNQQISATLVSPELAAALKVKAGSAALEVRRTYRTSDGRVAQLTFNTHPAARFQHSMTLRRVKA
ncbi:MAG: GntR family transcriptional regulator [Halioglobus sp.]|nr:GntR family transcriptional regulator [Halioglobus sp.]